jgi:hypothetical protein
MRPSVHARSDVNVPGVRLALHEQGLRLDEIHKERPMIAATLSTTMMAAAFEPGTAAAAG